MITHAELISTVRKYDHVIGRGLLAKCFEGLVPEGAEPLLVNLPEENYEAFYDRFLAELARVG